MTRALLINASVLCGIPALLHLWWGVHCALGRLCVRYAQRFCLRNGLHVSRVRSQPEFEPSGVKTEFTLVQLDCLDLQKQHRLVLLSVWPLGVRKLVSDQTYPNPYDEQWPTQCA
jgi:hypothetical protein